MNNQVVQLDYSRRTVGLLGDLSSYTISIGFNTFIDYTIIFLTFLFIGCAKNDVSQNSIEILAKVGDRIITPKDFQQRAEYTIRPDYCKGDSINTKKSF